MSEDTGEPGEPGEPGDGVFKVRLANFEGPFDLLLQLISKHKLDVTEVALSKVTDEFMAHIRAMGPDWDLDQTTEFLVVAATLLDLKAARLLPSAEAEDEADLALLEARLTQAALETLAVVAYRQPVSRSRVSAVRGVNCDGVMRTLLQRGLVGESGTVPETGAILYTTTNYFLERMGLRGLDELPELAPFLPEAEAIEAETQEAVPSFDPDAPDADDGPRTNMPNTTTTEL